MSKLEVTDVVSSIIAAFGNGLDLFRRMRAKQKPKKRSQKEAKLSEEELQLQVSLQHRPRDIKAEYERNRATSGRRFEIGDPAAHTSLGHILLVLNTGLINIITHALSDDRSAREISRQSLLGLSEKAAADTIDALSQLNQRLTPRPQLALTTTAHPEKRKGRPRKSSRLGDKEDQKSKVQSANSSEKGRPGPDPLVRGAWVRSKSGNSVVSLGLSNPRPKHQNRTNSSLSASKEQRPDGSQNQRPSLVTSQSGPPCVCQTRIMSAESLTHEPKRQRSSHGHRHPFEEPDLFLASPEVFGTTEPPPRPPKVPLEHGTSGMRPRPPSVATFLTASTKIGEIPEHRWLDRPAPSWEQRPLPYIIPPRLEEPVKRKKRGLRFWWKINDRDEGSVQKKMPIAAA